MKLSKTQMKAADKVARAMNLACIEGLSLRVYDGAVYLVTAEHLSDPRYRSDDGMTEWMDEALDVGGGIEADGEVCS